MLDSQENFTLVSGPLENPQNLSKFKDIEESHNPQSASELENCEPILEIKKIYESKERVDEIIENQELEYSDNLKIESSGNSEILDPKSYSEKPQEVDLHLNETDPNPDAEDEDLEDFLTFPEPSIDESSSDSDEMEKLEEKTVVESFAEEEYLECQYCQKSYKREAHLRRHLLKHNKSSKNPIDLENFPRKKRLRSAQCNKCGKNFTDPESYQHHNQARDCVPQENPKCRFCTIALPTLDDLERHLEKLHPKGKEHLCPICNKSFHSRSNRNTHIQSHNETNTFRCDVCGQGFKSTVYLSKHKKALHTKANNECPFCEVTFNSLAKFEYHLKSHSPDKKYKCKFCEKQFLQHHHLQNHERTHTGLFYILIF